MFGKFWNFSNKNPLEKPLEFPLEDKRIFQRKFYAIEWPHRVATLPGMWDRTITIGSAGKTFSVTGWKLGWAIGPEHLIRNCQVVHQNCVYACPTPTQEAVARCGKSVN